MDISLKNRVEEDLTFSFYRFCSEAESAVLLKSFEDALQGIPDLLGLDSSPSDCVGVGPDGYTFVVVMHYHAATVGQKLQAAGYTVPLDLPASVKEAAAFAAIYG